jgi:hypothetical protein
MHIKFCSENLMGRDSFIVEHGRDDNIRVDLNEIWHEDVDWIHMTHDRVLLPCEHGNVRTWLSSGLLCCVVW